MKRSTTSPLTNAFERLDNFIDNIGTLSTPVRRSLGALFTNSPARRSQEIPFNLSALNSLAPRSTDDHEPNSGVNEPENAEELGAFNQQRLQDYNTNIGVYSEVLQQVSGDVEEGEIEIIFTRDTEPLHEDLQDTTSQVVVTTDSNNNNINNNYSNKTSSGHEVRNTAVQNKTEVIASVLETFVGTTSIDRGVRGVGSVDVVPPVGKGSEDTRDEDVTTPVPCDRGTATVPANRGTAQGTDLYTEFSTYGIDPSYIGGQTEEKNSDSTISEDYKDKYRVYRKQYYTSSDENAEVIRAFRQTLNDQQSLLREQGEALRRIQEDHYEHIVDSDTRMTTRDNALADILGSINGQLAVMQDRYRSDALENDVKAKRLKDELSAAHSRQMHEMRTDLRAELRSDIEATVASGLTQLDIDANIQKSLVPITVELGRLSDTVADYQSRTVGLELIAGQFLELKSVVEARHDSQTEAEQQAAYEYRRNVRRRDQTLILPSPIQAAGAGGGGDPDPDDSDGPSEPDYFARGSFEPPKKPKKKKGSEPDDEDDLNPEDRARNNRRRSSIFGADHIDVPLQPTVGAVTQVIHMTTAKDFIDKIQLTSIVHIMTITNFMRELEKIKRTYPRSTFRIIEFCTTQVIADLETQAMTMTKYQGMLSQSWTSTLISLEEDEILEIIYDSVKATSNENFTTRLSRVKLTTGFEISKETYVELLKCASAYTHRFTEYLQIMAKRTNPAFIPPLSKTHGVKGIVQYYLEGYPDKIGVSLYETEVTENPLLGQQRDFKSFTLMFLQRLYARKESYLVIWY